MDDSFKAAKDAQKVCVGLGLTFKAAAGLGKQVAGRESRGDLSEGGRSDVLCSSRCAFCAC